MKWALKVRLEITDTSFLPWRSRSHAEYSHIDVFFLGHLKLLGFHLHKRPFLCTALGRIFKDGKHKNRLPPGLAYQEINHCGVNGFCQIQLILIEGNTSSSPAFTAIFFIYLLINFSEHTKNRKLLIFPSHLINYSLLLPFRDPRFFQCSTVK